MLPDAIIQDDASLDPGLSNFNPIGEHHGGFQGISGGGGQYEDLFGVSSGSTSDPTQTPNRSPVSLLNDWNDIFLGDFAPVDVW
jgi:hypothetical protein|tara:strand:+ start:3668 stop:3919 length:252 start_codon:yes stop_codon:yes gene_type:complete